jgi:hypothetical protein
VHNYSDDFALAAIRNGLQPGGAGTLRYDAFKRDFKTLQEFLIFAEGYIRAEEDAIRARRDRAERERSRSPRRKKGEWQNREDRTLTDHFGGKKFRQKNREKPVQKQERDWREMEYRPHFQEYAKFNRPKYEIFEILMEKYERPRPLPLEIFDVTSDTDYCEFHKKHGHKTEECNQLKDILEKMARSGELTQFIVKEFFEKNVPRYTGKERVYKRTLPVRKDWIEKQNRYKARNEQRGEQSVPEARERSPVIHVISGGLASGGDTRRERRSYLDRQEGLQVMRVDSYVGEKRPREEPICFSSRDREGITGPHDDAIVLSLKINVHRVERILIDTGSSADILYMPVFLAMGYEAEDLQPIRTPLVGFTGDTLQSEGRIKMRVDFGSPPQKVSTMVDFLVVDSPSAYT